MHVKRRAKEYGRKMMHMNLRRCTGDVKRIEESLVGFGGCFVETRRLSDETSYAEQFRKVLREAAEGNPVGNPERLTYFHVGMWDDAEDGITPEIMGKIGMEFADAVFPGSMLFVATEKELTDGRAKSHVVACAIDKYGGDVVPIRGTDFEDLRSKLSEIGERYGVSPWRPGEKRDPADLSYGERQILARGGFSWKQDLREKISAALYDAETKDEFFKLLEADGIKVMPTWSGKSFVYVHPKGKHPVGEERLGAEYTQKRIDEIFAKKKKRGG